ncbi:FxDxF family PEP-CTERM protein, partial [Leclercia adecarboxylata]|uniref:FxDxF family PEP-CTERM protein n=1 Tax=Leclercia adecarboxylata TaxID=83655 RepID=UPI00234CDBF5
PYAQFDAGSLTGPNALFNTAGGGRLELQSFFGSSNFTYNIAGTDKLGTLTISAVPEPQTYALMLGGLAAVAFIARRRKA